MHIFCEKFSNGNLIGEEGEEGTSTLQQTPYLAPALSCVLWSFINVFKEG